MLSISKRRPRYVCNLAAHWAALLKRKDRKNIFLTHYRLSSSKSD